MWRRDPLISQFVQMGYMDYGMFNIDIDEEVKLQNMGITLAPHSLHTPPFLVFSRVLSAARQDVVMLDGATVKPGMLTLLKRATAAPTSCLEDYRCMPRGAVRRRYSWSFEEANVITLPWWAELGPSLQRARGDVPRSIVAVPTGFVRTVRCAQRWSTETVLALVADEGVYDVSEWDVVQAPLSATHGYASLPVNATVLRAWTEATGGFQLCSAQRESFRVGTWRAGEA